MFQVPTRTAKMCTKMQFLFSGSTDGLLRFWENEEGKSSIFLAKLNFISFLFWSSSMSGSGKIRFFQT